MTVSGPDSHATFWVGNVAAALYVVAYMGGCYVAKPWRQPTLGWLSVCVIMLYFLCELWRTADSPIKARVPNLLSRDPDGLLDNLDYLASWLLLIGTFSLFRALNNGALAELEPLRNTHPEKGESTAASERHVSLSTKKREVIAHQLALNVEHLAFVCTAHPVPLFLFWWKERRRVQKNVDRLLIWSKRWRLLDYALMQCNVARLLAFGSSESQKMLRGETDRLSREAKASLLDGLQKNVRSLRANKKRQKWVAALLRSTDAVDLVVLKNILDGGGDYHSLRKLIFEDILSLEARNDILTHFSSVYSASESGASAPSATADPIARKILSDIDDTLYSSGGHFPAGVDKKYPKHLVYPGLLQLYRQLDVQWRLTELAGKLNSPWLNKAKHRNSQAGGKLEDMPCNLVFLSARPHIYKDVSERVSYRLFKQLVREGNLHTMPTLVPGRCSSSVSAVLKTCCRRRDAWKGVGVQKYNSMCDFKKLYPKYSLVFFGDNGQGDLLAAELGLEDRVIEVAFINDVGSSELCVSKYSSLPLQEREAKWRELGLYIVQSPVDAAVHACRTGLITADSLQKVCDSAVEDIEAASISNPHFPSWHKRFEELNVAIAEAREFCPHAKLLDIEALEDELRQLLFSDDNPGGSYSSESMNMSLIEDPDPAR